MKVNTFVLQLGEEYKLIQDKGMIEGKILTDGSQLGICGYLKDENRVYSCMDCAESVWGLNKLTNKQDLDKIKAQLHK